MTRLIVDPLTRVEGHGRVELQVNQGHLVDVRVRLLEAPRLFESMVVGRHYEEVPDLVCRICAICSAVHKLTSLQALEKAMEINVPPLAATIRELLLLGGHIQSHALHLFCLILPDLYGAPDILQLLTRKAPLAQAGLDLKAFANRVQQVAGGRTVHPVNPVLGGVAYRPGLKDLESLAEELYGWQRDWPGISSEFMQLSNYPEASPTIGNAITTGSQENFSLSGDHLHHGWGRVSEVSAYAQLLGECSCHYSHAKQADGDSGPFLTGALARAKQAERRSLQMFELDNTLGIHGNNTAQIEEISWGLQRLGQLLEALLKTRDPEPLKAILKQPRGCRGTAAMEAPRGLLVHHYVIDEWGTVVAADIITPTAINQQAIAAQILADLANESDHGQIKLVTERIVRAYDPCISCAVHLVTV